MNLFYVVWDYADEKLFDKRNTSDCAQFSELLGWPTSGEWRSKAGRARLMRILQGWAIFWFTYEALVFTAAVFAGIMVFRVSDVCQNPVKFSLKQS